MANVTLKQLRYFESLALHGHFGRAADACSISQPALSLQIKELESQREDIEMALQELHRGIEWLEGQLDKIGPGAAEAENLKAYDEVARRQLDDA